MIIPLCWEKLCKSSKWRKHNLHHFVFQEPTFLLWNSTKKLKRITMCACNNRMTYSVTCRWKVGFVEFCFICATYQKFRKPSELIKSHVWQPCHIRSRRDLIQDGCCNFVIKLYTHIKNKINIILRKSGILEVLDV